MRAPAERAKTFGFRAVVVALIIGVTGLAAPAANALARPASAAGARAALVSAPAGAATAPRSAGNDVRTAAARAAGLDVRTVAVRAAGTAGSAHRSVSPAGLRAAGSDSAQRSPVLRHASSSGAEKAQRLSHGGPGLRSPPVDGLPVQTDRDAPVAAPAPPRAGCSGYPSAVARRHLSRGPPSVA